MEDAMCLVARLTVAAPSSDTARQLATLTADYDVAVQLQAHPAFTRAAVAFLKAAQGRDEHEDAVESVSLALSNVAGAGIANNGVPADVTVRPLDGDEGDQVDNATATVSVQAVDYVSGGIGYKLWDSGHLLARFLVSRAGRELLRGKRVVELGSGLGLCGVLAARTAERIVLSDYKESLVSNLRTALERNCIGDHASAVLLDWSWFSDGRDDGHAHLPADVQALAGWADVVIGSDLVFEDTALHLPSVVRFLLRPGGQFVSINAASHVHLVSTFNDTFERSFADVRISTVPRDWYDGFRRSTAEPEHYMHYGQRHV